NKSWVPIATTTVRRAIQLVMSDAARVVEPGSYQAHDFTSWAELQTARDEECIRTVSKRIRVPEIILLTLFNGYPRMEVAFTRRNLYRRDNFTCQYCGSQPGGAELSIDHVMPRSKGGRSSWTNCVLACTSCNRRKANKLPAEAHMTLARPPRCPAWTPILEVPLVRIRQSWKHFVSERYWNLPLEA
ncbi:MAG: HNH endonuclease, partial [Planctomycetes bacterium]|nr:HNH endonuclease [Planctomycetota bacterium]